MCLFLSVMEVEQESGVYESQKPDAVVRGQGDRSGVGVRSRSGLGQWLYQGGIPGPAASASAGNLLETQGLRFHPRLAESGTGGGPSSCGLENHYCTPPPCNLNIPSC